MNYSDVYNEISRLITEIKKNEELRERYKKQEIRKIARERRHYYSIRDWGKVDILNDEIRKCYSGWEQTQLNEINRKNKFEIVRIVYNAFLEYREEKSKQINMTSNEDNLLYNRLEDLILKLGKYEDNFKNNLYDISYVYHGDYYDYRDQIIEIIMDIFDRIDKYRELRTCENLINSKNIELDEVYGKIRELTDEYENLSKNKEMFEKKVYCGIEKSSNKKYLILLLITFVSILGIGNFIFFKGLESWAYLWVILNSIVFGFSLKCIDKSVDFHNGYSKKIYDELDFNIEYQKIVKLLEDKQKEINLEWDKIANIQKEISSLKDRISELKREMYLLIEDDKLDIYNNEEENVCKKRMRKMDNQC